MKFLDWIKIKEQGAPPAAAPAASPSVASSPSATSASSTSISSGTSTSDIAKVPQRMFSGERQTSDKCRNCSKDWKNWFYTKRKKKK